MKLSICMMVKNESKYLEKCLRSLKPIMNKIKSELIIVDTGSEDNTVEIAKRFTDKVYYHEWTNDFSEMRNITIGYAKGEWIFIIDGDEVVDNPKEIINFLKESKSKRYSAATVIIKSFKRGHTDKVYDEIPILRLFKRNKDFKFEGKIHEQPKIRGPIYFINTRLLHYGYITTDKKLMERKFKRNIEILKDELGKDPYNVYYWFQLSATYGMNKNYKKALEASIRAYQLAKEKGIDLRTRMYVYTHLAVCYFWNKKYKELEEICKEAIGTKDGYIDIYFLLGEAQKELKKDDEAIKSFNTYLKMSKDYSKYPGYKDYSVASLTLCKYEEVYMNLCILYERLENYEEVLNYASKIKDKGNLGLVIPNMIKAYLELEKYSQLREYYDNKIVEDNDNLKDIFLNALENIKSNYDDTIQESIVELFTNTSGEYGILNRIRLSILKENKMSSESLELIKKIELNEAPYYYGDIIYYLLLNNIRISDIYPNLRYKKIQEFIYYISSKYEDVHNMVIGYIKGTKSNFKLSEIRINRAIYSILLTSEELEDIEYRLILDRYVNEGTYYVKEIYNKRIIENELVYDIKDEEDVFLIYLYLANQVKPTDQLMYVKYLRKALNVYPKMKKAIETLLKEVKTQKVTEVNDLQNNSKLEKYKTMVKDKIKGFVNNGEIGQAKNLIKEYEKLVKGDVDIYSIKAVIAMMENRLDIAEKLLNEGLAIDSKNCDLLYNKAYLLKIKGNEKEANRLYRRVLELTGDEELRKEIQKELLDYGDREENRVNNMGRKNTASNNDIIEEFESHKKRLKDNINKLIENQKLTEAKLLIDEYEKIVPKDLEILMYKSRIFLIETELLDVDS